MLPIWNHRNLVGYASTQKQVQRIIYSTFQTIPSGWKVTVKRRDTAIIDLPDGWIFSIHP